MKLLVKTLNGKQLPIEFDDGATVPELKAVIEKDHGLKAETLKLIAAGKVLDDGKKVADYDLGTGFIVAMQQKAKPAPKPKPAEEAKAEDPVPGTTTTAPAATTAPATNPSPAATQPPAQPAPATASASTGAGGPGPQLPPQVEQAATELMAISGQSKEACLRALAAAQGVPDIAFELLMSGGVPEGDMPEGDDYGDEGAAGMDPGAGSGDPFAGFPLDAEVRQQLSALVNNANFGLVRQRLVEDPAFSQQFMARIQESQPRVFQAIQANPQLLMAIVLGHNPMQGVGAPMGMPAAPQQPPAGAIQVSPEESEAINRLASLGFSKIRAAEAYFAMDKNEEMAANFLFEAGAEDEDVATQQAIAASQQASQPPVQVPVAAPEGDQQPAAEGGAQQDSQNNNNAEGNGNNNNNEGGASGDNAGAGGDGAGAAGGGSSLL